MNVDFDNSWALHECLRKGWGCVILETQGSGHNPSDPKDLESLPRLWKPDYMDVKAGCFRYRQVSNRGNLCRKLFYSITMEKRRPYLYPNSELSSRTQNEGNNALRRQQRPAPCICRRVRVNSAACIPSEVGQGY